MSFDPEDFDEIMAPAKPDPRQSPEREAQALLLAQQAASVDVAKEHERDLIDFHEGRMTEADYREAESSRAQYVDSVKVFFNLRVGDYCFKDVPWEAIPCGRCGRQEPGDPCEVCGRSQPRSCEDYDRANQQMVFPQSE